jgi:hypothetical protein
MSADPFSFYTMTTKFRRHLTTSSFLLLTSTFFSACSPRSELPPGYYDDAAVAPPPELASASGGTYTRTMNDSRVVSKKTEPASNAEVRRLIGKPQGITTKETVSESIYKNGKLQKHQSTAREKLNSGGNDNTIPTPNKEVR